MDRVAKYAVKEAIYTRRRLSEAKTEKGIVLSKIRCDLVNFLL